VWDAQAAAAAGCPPHLLLSGQAEAHRNGSLPPGLPPGTQVHQDLVAFADWLLQDASKTIA
jgi:D-glycero-D-manno-heptose 1,7-bisphosphate phosphatase